MVCTFCGHRNIYEVGVEEKTKEVIIDLIENCNVDTFYVGGMGEFDSICSSIIRTLKNKYNIKLILFLPYFSNKLNTEKEYYYNMFDKILIADTEMLYYKQRITKRNQIMVDYSDYIICYVVRNFGGAYKTMKYAEKKQKNIIRVNS